MLRIVDITPINTNNFQQIKKGTSLKKRYICDMKTNRTEHGRKANWQLKRRGKQTESAHR